MKEEERRLKKGVNIVNWLNNVNDEERKKRKGKDVGSAKEDRDFFGNALYTTCNNGICKCGKYRVKGVRRRKTEEEKERKGRR